MGYNVYDVLKKLTKNIKFKKMHFFMKTQEIRVKFYLNFILKLLNPHLGLL
jgi:hypothetical protein